MYMKQNMSDKTRKNSQDKPKNETNIIMVRA